MGEKLKNTDTRSTNLYANILVVGISTFLFLLSIRLMADAFGLIGQDFARYILEATANPSIGLFIGLLTTAILQSSSTTTSMTVATVASGSLALESAIPIIMGANIGTTLTSTIVAMSYVTKKKEFRKAIAAGTIHDLFNLLTVLMLFPLEVRYGLLTKISHAAATLVHLDAGGSSVGERFFIYRFLGNLATQLMDWIGPYPVLILAFVLLFATVKYISKLLYHKLIGDAREQFRSMIFQNTFKSFGWGFVLTSAIQSSSLTSSLIVPLVATGKVKLKRAFQFILGANLGTTITALLAAMFKSEAAISLAFAHLFFNLFGVIVFLGIPYTNQLPRYLAKKLGAVSLRYRLTALAYILIIFFLLPFTLIYLGKNQ